MTNRTVAYSRGIRKSDMDLAKPDVTQKNASHEALTFLACIGSLFLVFSINEVAFAEIDCRKCHADPVKKKVVHTAIQMGCPTCHSGIDATVIPHKKTNKIKMRLFMLQLS
jgi:hypothetical protein